MTTSTTWLVKMLLHAALCLALFAQWAHAQTYPSRPVRLVVATGPGGGDDFVARTLAAKLTEILGQSFVVENRAGAGGSLAQNFVAKAPSDGYTLLLGGRSMAGARLVNRNAAFDVLSDFSHISLIESSPFVLAVSSASPARSLKDLLDGVRARPGQATFGTLGAGQIPYWGVQLMNRMAGLQAVEVVYKNASDVVIGLIGGQIEYAVIAISLAVSNADKLRLLAVTGATRSEALPDVPSMAEAGLPGYEMAAFRGLLGPAGLPADVVTILSDGVRRSLAAPAVIQQLKGAGSEPQSSSPEQLRQRFAESAVVFERVAKDNGITPQ